MAATRFRVPDLPGTSASASLKRTRSFSDDEEEEQSRRHRPFPALFANSSASVNKSRRPALERSLSISDLGLEVTASISAARSPSTATSLSRTRSLTREDIVFERVRRNSNASFTLDSAPYQPRLSHSTHTSRSSSPAIPIPSLPNISAKFQLKPDRVLIDFNVATEDAQAGVAPVCWSSKNFVVFGRGNRIHYKNMSSTEDISQLCKIRGSHGNLRLIESAPDPAVIALCTSKGHIQLYDLPTKTLTATWQTKNVTAMRWNGPVLTVGGQRGVIRHFDTRIQPSAKMKEQTRKVTRHQANITCLAWHKDGKLMASGDEGGLSLVWDSRKPGGPMDVGETIQRRKKMQHDGPVSALAWCPWSDKLLASGDSATTQTGTIRFWDVKDSSATSNLTREIKMDAHITSLHFSEHTKEILSTHGAGKSGGQTSVENSVVVHYYPTLHQILSRKAGEKTVACSAISPNGQRIVLGLPEEGKLKVWDVWAKPRSFDSSRFGGPTIR